jgi:hypothetical protein
MKYGLVTLSVVYMSEMLLSRSQFHLVYLLARVNHYSDGQLCDWEALGSRVASHVHIQRRINYRVAAPGPWHHLSSSLRQCSGSGNQTDCFLSRYFN